MFWRKLKTGKYTWGSDPIDKFIHYYYDTIYYCYYTIDEFMSNKNITFS